MNGERGTPAVRSLLEHAERLAAERGAIEVGSEHLLLAIAKDQPGHLGTVFEKHQVTSGSLGPKVKSEEPDRPAGPGPLAPSPAIAAAVANAGKCASFAGRGAFDPEDLLLAILRDHAAQATQLLKGYGVTGDMVANDLRQLRGQENAIAKAESKDEACPFHVGPGSCEPHDGMPAVPGLAGELRDLSARFDALVENHHALQERTADLVGYLRVVWAVSLALLGGMGFLAYKIL